MQIGKFVLRTLAAAGVIMLSGCNACTEQHDPSADHKLFNEESSTANQQFPTLKDDGSLPEKPEPTDSGDVAQAESTSNAGVQKYNQFCASCHGTDGKAGGPVAAAMNPKPRNFTDAAWQDSVDDARIAKVIKEGGASVGLSPTMAPWGAVLSEEELGQIVEHVRSFKQ